MKEEPVQIVNGIPGNDAAEQHLEQNEKAFIFEVDSGVKDESALCMYG